MRFDKAFPLDMHKYVGRIANITAGTYENAGTYVHATMFAVAALFLMGESKEAWRQFEMATVLSHPNCTKSPFAMPNSYFRNEDWCIDGQSFADWYTGSRKFVINGKEMLGEFDSMMNIPKLFVPTTDITDGMIIEVID